MSKRKPHNEIYCVADSSGKVESIMNVDDVAGFLRQERSTVLKMVKTGEIPSYKVKNKILFKTCDVWSYFLRQKNTGNSIENTNNDT